MHQTLSLLQRELSNGLSDLPAEWTQARRGPEKWSIQQIVEHLLLTYQLTTDTIAARVAKGSPTKAAPTLTHRAGQLIVVHFGRFPLGRLAPAAVDPAASTSGPLSAHELNARIAESLTSMDGVLMRAEERFGPTQRSVSHMVLGPMSIHQWRRFHLVHGEHHLQQILATRRTMS